MTIEENIPLAPYTTFKIGGPARFFIRVKNREELTQALAFAREKALSLFMLGGGSNILVSDLGFPGVVIKIEIMGREYNKSASGTTEVISGAGENWDSFVGETVARGLHGLENLSFIPGTVGAAPVQNIGAYGVEAKDTISWVEVTHSETGEMKRFSNGECTFSYRNSVFKTIEGKKWVITRVAFELSPSRPLSTTYKDIQNYMLEAGKAALTQQEIRDAVIAIRTRKLPDWTVIGTAGSFFKNPIIPRVHYEKLVTEFPGLPFFETAHKDEVKVPAAWLLDHVGGFKGVEHDHVGVYQNQALVIVNRGGATAHDVDTLAEEMKKTIEEKTGIVLEREVESVGVPKK